MTSTGQRPLLFLDVDGPLIKCIAPWLGLPSWPVVSWPKESHEVDQDGLHWKTRGLVDRAGGRAFAWVDDEITDTDRAWVARHHRGRALLHRVDPRHGLTDAGFAALVEWPDRC
ncbi:hypothetical protein ABZ154_11085 [Streptomyces sp. NPDC006261]|uniref:hypothetical protein n=1 Tax=Streptomyces sp. NPDC006261 TaxID=3156739 RepID=UPI0033B17DB0